MMSCQSQTFYVPVSNFQRQHIQAQCTIPTGNVAFSWPPWQIISSFRRCLLLKVHWIDRLERHFTSTAPTLELRFMNSSGHTDAAVALTLGDLGCCHIHISLLCLALLSCLSSVILLAWPYGMYACFSITCTLFSFSHHRFRVPSFGSCNSPGCSTVLVSSYSRPHQSK